jgi:hypothetical protein
VPDVRPARDGAVLCRSAVDCQDGLFCNGHETCAPADPRSDENGCVAGAPPCEGACSEEGAGCEDCAPADADGDGWAALACGGPDCDDADPNRFPENVEVCDTDGHDEDCELETLGALDLDEDGEVSSGCCNGASCGRDCDDMNAAVGSFGTERCNGRDDDCDGRSDEGLLVPRYADLDSDGFGDDFDVLLACAPTGRHVVVRGGDCDDGRASVSPVGREVCNGLDDDCSGVVDDGDALASCLGAGVRDAACVSGVCEVMACEPDRADCDGNPSNGCEADLNSLDTCGSCHVACEPRPYGTAACIEHVCDQSTCNYDAHRCDGRCVRRSLDSCGADCLPCAPVVHGRAYCGRAGDGEYQCGAYCDSGYELVSDARDIACIWGAPWPIVIEVVGAFLVPAFRADLSSYRVDVPYESGAVRVRVVMPDEAEVVLALGEQPLVSGLPSAPVPVSVGETILHIDSTAASGRFVHYTLRIVRAPEATP